MKTKTEYNQLKKQIEAKYKQALATAEVERNESLRAIGKVWDLYHPPKLKQSKEPVASSLSQQTNTTADTADGEPVKTEPLKYGSFGKIVKQALAFVPREKFKRSDVLTALKQSLNDPTYYCNQASLSNCLKGLANDGFIEIVKQGKGSSPSEYRLKQSGIPTEPIENKSE